MHDPEHTADGKAVVAPYWPGGQNVQAPEDAGLYCPATHTCAVAEVEPSGQAYPA